MQKSSNNKKSKPKQYNQPRHDLTNEIVHAEQGLSKFMQSIRELKPWKQNKYQLYGHNEAINAFIRMMAQSRGHHAVMLSGPASCGKATLAFRLITFILSGILKGYTDINHHKEEIQLISTLLSKGEEFLNTIEAKNLLEDIAINDLKLLDIGYSSIKQSFRAEWEQYLKVKIMVEKLIHPDLLYINNQDVDAKETFIGKGQNSIGIEDILKIQHFLHLGSTHGGMKIVCIDGVENITVQAANALLKMMEEPNEDSMFILLTAEQDTLLPTLRSRCLHLSMQRLNKLNFIELLQHLASRGDQYQFINAATMKLPELYDITGGNVLYALKLINMQDKIDELNRQLARLLELLLGRKRDIAYCVGIDLYSLLMQISDSLLLSNVQICELFMSSLWRQCKNYILNKKKSDITDDDNDIDDQIVQQCTILQKNLMQIDKHKLDAKTGLLTYIYTFIRDISDAL